METKKKNSSKFFGFSNFNFSIGLALSMFLVVCAFEWKFYISPAEVIEVPAKVKDRDEMKVIVLAVPKVSVPKSDIKTREIPEIIDIVKEEEEEVIKEISIVPIDEPLVVNLKEYEPGEETVEVAPFFYNAEVMPVFEYKKQNFIQYVGKKFIFPSNASGITGTVYVQFIVDLDGTITEIEILKGLGKSIDEEALRVVKNAPKWTPAKQGGKAVRVKMVLPIRVGL